MLATTLLRVSDAITLFMPTCLCGSLRGQCRLLCHLDTNKLTQHIDGMQADLGAEANTAQKQDEVGDEAEQVLW